MKKTVNFRIVAIIFLCLLAVEATPCKTSSQIHDAVADEYSVYAAALDKYVGSGSYVAAATTFVPVREKELDRALSFPIDDADHLSRALIEDFKSRNRHSQPLAQHFPEGIHVVFLSEIEHKSLFASSIEEGWDNFYRKYPGASGITYLSRVGFNQKRDTALIYVSNVRNGEVGGGAYLLLTKSNGKWSVISRTRGWIT